MRRDDLKRCLPPYLTDTQTFRELFNSEGLEFDTLNSGVSDIEAQFDIFTATWALDIYEKELEIATDYVKPLDYRRSVVQSKWRGSGKLNAALIKTVCDAFTNGDVQVTFDGTIHVKFNSIVGIPPNLEDLKAAVDRIKPAYLLLAYLFSYVLISGIDHVMSIDQLQSMQLSNFAGGA